METVECECIHTHVHIRVTCVLLSFKHSFGFWATLREGRAQVPRPCFTPLRLQWFYSPHKAWTVNSLRTYIVTAQGPETGTGSLGLPLAPCEDIPLPPQKGSPQYQLLTVPEHSPRGTLVGNVTGAVDADEGPNAIVYYFIAGGAGQS